MEVVLGQNKSRYQFLLVALAFCTWGFIFLDRLAIYFLLPVIQQDISISYTQVGVIGFWTALFYSASAIIVGIMADKMGNRKRLLVIFVFGAAIFSGLCAVTETLGQLMVCRAFVGLCEGPVLPLLLSLVADVSGSKNYGRNAGIVNAGVAVIASTLGPVFVTQLAVVYNWQYAFLLSAVPTFILAILLMFLVKNTQKVDLSTGVEATDAVAKQKVKFSDLLKYRNFIICCIIAILEIGAYWVINTYASLYLTNVAKLSVTAMGFAMGVMGLLTIFYDVFFPKLSDNFGRRKIVTIAFSIAFLGPLGMFIFQGSYTSVIFFMLFGGAVAGSCPIIMAVIPSETLPLALRTTAIAVCMGLGEFVGGTLWPFVAGVISDARGVAFMFLICAIMMALIIVLCRLLKETHAKKSNTELDTTTLSA